MLQIAGKPSETIAALRGAATLKARAPKEVWNVAAVIPVEKGGHGHYCSRFVGGKLKPDDNFLGLCSEEFLSRGTELLKRTRKGGGSSHVKKLNRVRFWFK